MLRTVRQVWHYRLADFDACTFRGQVVGRGGWLVGAVGFVGGIAAYMFQPHSSHALKVGFGGVQASDNPWSFSQDEGQVIAALA